MRSQPWITQVWQVCMVTLFRIGVEYHCCWTLCNKCYLDLGLIAWLLFYHILFNDTRGLDTRAHFFKLGVFWCWWGPSIYKALNKEWWFRFNMNMIHSSSILCIVWFIKQILWYKPFQTYLWFFALNLFTMFVWYFSHSPKEHLEFTKLVKIWQQKGKKKLHNIKLVRWIFMINPIKCVLFEYHTFFMKMALDVAQTLDLILFFFFHWHGNIVGGEWSDAIVRSSTLFD